MLLVIFGYVLAGLLLLWVGLTYTKLAIPGGFYVLTLKIASTALSPIVAFSALVAAAVAGHVILTITYVLILLMAILPVVMIAMAKPVTSDSFPSGEGTYMLRRLWGLWMSPVPEPRCKRDLPFWTPPEGGGQLLCDIWSPPSGIAPSGLAFIYFHGSGWVMLDKDVQTRPFFRRLAAQGHVVMDVAYRLYPDTDMAGMVGDVRRAVAWMRAHAAEYGVHPDRIVIGGGSAGGHLSLLAAFTDGNPHLTPADVRNLDTSVAGVVSVYGPVDLRTCYAQRHVDKSAELMKDPPKDWNAPLPPLVQKLFGQTVARWKFNKAMAAGRLDWILGGKPGALPDQYSLFSPVEHFHPDCPPVLMIHGTDDLVSPAADVAWLGNRLREMGVPASTLILPYTDHAFDMVLFNLGPATRVAMWHLERFLMGVAELPARRLRKVAVS